MKAESRETSDAASERETAGEDLLDVVDLPEEVGGFPRARVERVRRAVRDWTRQLIDLGGRNNLLHYRDLKAGTLDLSSAEPTAVKRLFQSKTVRISALFPDADERKAALRRARTIHKKAKENFEERGIGTLFLGCGLATWENEKSVWDPNAPVLLRRASIRPLGAAQDEFELLLVDEMEVNAILLQILKIAFDCSFDQEELVGRVDGGIDELWELDAAYDWMQDHAERVPNFNIEPRLVLGNFSYAKLPMVKDLEEAFDELVGHDLIAAIAGDEEAREAIRAAAPALDAVPDPDHIPLADEFLILDADASQNYVINAVLAGANLIVRGPPGTGKSQTIANLVGSLVAHGKKVLFVAEKRAAIDAVLKRLQQQKLGDLVLDLHGGNTTRRSFAETIGRALRVSRTAPKVENESHLGRLERRREELNGYMTALHQERRPWGISVYEIRAQLVGLNASTGRSDIRFRDAVLEKLDANLKRQVEDDLLDYTRRGGFALNSGRSPWRNSNIVTAEQVQQAHALLEEMRRGTLPNTLATLAQLSENVDLPLAPTLKDWELRLRLIEDVGQVLTFFRRGIYEEDLDGICDSLAPAGKGSFARLRAFMLSGNYRQARRAVRKLLFQQRKTKDEELLRNSVLALEQLGRWRSLGGKRLPVHSVAVAEALESYEKLRRQIAELEEYTGDEGLFDLSAEDVERRIREMLGDRRTLVQLPEIRRLQASLTDAGLGEFLGDMESKKVLDEEVCLRSFRYSWLQSILDHLSVVDPVVGGFVPEKHTKVVEDFKAGDRAHIEATPGRISRICAEQAVEARDKFKSQDELIRHQASLRRKHLPVRELIKETSDVLLALKPCWAMSPLVVSQLLPPKTHFDVVIFDEASQITPADAITSILRGSQLVVAGDEKQLPPTAFFVSEAPEEDDEALESERLSSVVAGTRGFESILDALDFILRPRMLEWHYRSRDERLIAFSNAHIYGRMLTTFPGIGDEEVLSHVVVSWDPAAEPNSPRPEVEAVVDLIVEHARTRPDESLGVITMGIKHANRIEDCLRDRLSLDKPLEEELADFLDETREEPFFVKNLERVQGDERDAIILSIGYGKNSRGDLVYRFGPLLVEGGERRLNVAVTRAKLRITLVSSFSSRDMDPERSSAAGVVLLRQYLQYIESNGVNLGDTVMDKPALNPFELDVRDTLSRHGLKLTAQYGSSGYWIDFAVGHPTDPGRHVLAIECDGKTYHSSTSARDRDRLRQEQLERIGWRFCRIWSTEWFDNKEKAVAKVISAYEQAVDAAERDEDAEAPSKPRDMLSQGVGLGESARKEPSPSRERWPPIPRGRPIKDYTQGQLVRVARWIESDGLLRTEDEMLAEMMRELGFQRRGNSIVTVLRSALRTARQ